VVSTQLRELSC